MSFVIVPLYVCGKSRMTQLFINNFHTAARKMYFFKHTLKCWTTCSCRERRTGDKERILCTVKYRTYSFATKEAHRSLISDRGLFAHVILHVPEDTVLLFDTYNVQRRQTIMSESNVKQLSYGRAYLRTIP